MSHSVEALIEELDCEPRHVRPWLALSRGRIPEDGLSDHLAASIAAAVTLHQAWPSAGKKLDRFFVNLAFQTSPKEDWIAVRRPRIPAQVVLRADAGIDPERHDGFVTVFDPKAFLAGLKRKAAGRRDWVVFVVELDDEVGPRRDDEKPNLYVGHTVGSPEKQIERLLKGTSGPPWLRGLVLRGRPDLVPARFEGSKSQLTKRLSAEGYTVDR